MSLSQPECVRLLEALERVEDAIRGSQTRRVMLEEVLEATLEVLGCDRAFLLHPCDPTAPSFRVPLERTVPKWPGAGVLEVDLPIDERIAALFTEVLAADDRVHVMLDVAKQLPEMAEQFQMRSQAFIVVRPDLGSPWVLGVHYCEAIHEPAEVETRILRGIGRRVSDALTAWLTHEELLRSEQRYRTLVDHAPEAIILADADTTIVEANPAAASLFGREVSELLSTRLLDLRSATRGRDDPRPAHVLAAVAAATRGETRVVELELEQPNGRRIPCEVRIAHYPSDSKLTRYTLVSIEERLRIEAQLRQAQKLEVVAQVAGGIAHDFNNLITVIRSAAELLAESNDAPELTEIKHAAEHATAIARQLVDLGRGAVAPPDLTDLNAAISTWSTLFRTLCGPLREFELTLADDAGHVRVDVGELQQVVMNLVVNARDAVREGGTVSLRTHTVQLGDGAPFARISVSDDGIGMDEETRRRIFDPFFTTKPVGRGTGLGLSTVARIVKGWVGRLTVESAPGRGSRFEVAIPALTPELGEPTKLEPEASSDASQHVLVADDNPSVARLVARMLRAVGLRCTTAASAEEALCKWDEAPHEYALVITDVIMPGLSGLDLARRLRQRAPKVPILCISGFAPAEELETALAERLVEFLPKPFTHQALTDVVSEMLAGVSPCRRR